MELSPFYEANSLHSYSKMSQYIIEPEVLLPCSQEPATGPYPEPNESNPYYPVLFL
jgi:hypothetical protein